MPSRPVTFAIIAFWLLTAGWFVSRDVLPHWRTGEPPPYTIDLADETLQHVVIRWTFTLNDRKAGTIRTGLIYRDSDDTFEWTASSPELTLATIGEISVVVRDFDDAARVTREGDLRALKTNVRLGVQGLNLTATFEMTADVRQGRLYRHALFAAPGFARREWTLEPTDPPRGNVLNPMHPIPRITGLRPGQEWRQPLTDPRSDIIRTIMPGLPESPPALQARVLMEPRIIEWNGESHTCLVIEYSGDEYTARTWVRESDGMVLRQEAEAHGETLVLQRE
jgi:hypothetical protein